jgi:hypothetical protein
LLEGIWLGNELNTPNFFRRSVKHKKVYTFSDSLSMTFRKVPLPEECTTSWSGGAISNADFG